MGEINQQPQDQKPDVLMVAPNGDTAYIPWDKVEANEMQNKAEVGVRMTAPNGDQAVIPFSKQDANQKQIHATWDVHPDNDVTKAFMTERFRKQGQRQPTPGKAFVTSIAGVPIYADVEPGTEQAVESEIRKQFAAGTAGAVAGELTGGVVGGALEGVGGGVTPALARAGVGALKGAATGGSAGAVGGAVAGTPQGVEGMKKGAEYGGVGGAALGAAVGGISGGMAEPTEQPSRIKQVVLGKKVAQTPAQASMREAAGQASESAGAVPAAVKGQGIRTLLDNPINTLEAQERATYDALNKAADADLKDLYETREALSDELRDVTSFTNKEVVADRLRDIESRIQTAEANARRNNVPPETLQTAINLTKRRFAFQEVQKKLFNNESIVSGDIMHGRDETINVDQAIKVVQNLKKPSRYAPEGRLTQVFGEQGGKQLLQDLYDAQAAGEKAVGIQKWAKWIAYGLAVSGPAIGLGKLAIGHSGK